MTTFVPITPLPQLDRTDPNFRSDVDEFFGEQLPLFSTSLNTYGTQIAEIGNASQQSADASASSASDSLAHAEASAASAAEADASRQLAEEALAASAVPKFVAGTNYAEGTVVYASNLENYRAMTTGVRTTDPALDPVNWYWLGYRRAQTAAMFWAFTLD